MSVEVTPGFNVSYSPDVFQKIEESGQEVHWFSEGEIVESISISFDRFGESADDISFFAGYLTRYPKMPAIVDKFDKDADRHAWLATQPTEVAEVYEDNRLRINRIIPVVFGMGVMADYMDPGSPVAEKLHVISSELVEKFHAEDRSRMSLAFVDLVAAKSIEALAVLSED